MVVIGDERKLRVLCLHGYRQNGKLFRSKIGAWRKVVSKLVDPVFIDAPNIVQAPLESNDIVEDSRTADDSEEERVQRGWWFSKQLQGEEKNSPSTYLSFNSHDYTDLQVGFESSLTSVEKAFQEEFTANGKFFDGILGFSQGACLTSILCMMQERKELNFKFDFAIMFSPFKSRSTAHDKFFVDKTTCKSIPTLLVIGEGDTVVEQDMQLELTEYFTDKSFILKHPGGHFVPANGAYKQTYLDFLKNIK